MLQPAYSEAHENPATSQALSPAYVLDVVSRRWVLFAAVFLSVLMAGLIVLKFLPAIYVSEGRILIEAQLIPTELVRPTVSSLANERVQTIEQRIMTRDKLLALANKYKMFSGGQAGFSTTEMLDFMRERTQIKPFELKMPAGRTSTRQTIAFTVGFEHDNPQTAQRVASELVTMILDEDVRTRTAYASETTKFLEREVKRLEAELIVVDAQISESRAKQIRNPVDDLQARQLMALRAELTQKSAVYSDTHPDVAALRKRMIAVEKLIAPAAELGANLEALERAKESIQKNLEFSGPKLAAARMGENLERGQQSERLEVIEQPTLPQKPIKPNRIKLFAMIVAAALAGGAGLVVLLEMLDTTLRRRADLFSFVDPNLVVSIPVVSTIQERLRRKRRLVTVSACSVAVVAVATGATLFLMQEPEILSQIRLALKL